MPPDSMCKDLAIGKWLSALGDASGRVWRTLEGLCLGDDVAKLMRDEYGLLIGSPAGERVMRSAQQADPTLPYQTIAIRGRNIATGLPDSIDVSFTEIRAALRSKAEIMRYVDWTTKEGGHTIGTLLYHMAAIEAKFLFGDVLQQPRPPEIEELFPHDVRDAAGRLTIVQGATMDQHTERFRIVRRHLLEVYRKMSIYEFQRYREVQDDVITAEWAIHHICQHEAEHRAEISALYAAAKMDLE